MKSFIARLREPSTWSSIATALVGLGFMSQGVADELVNGIGQGSIAVGTLVTAVGMWRRERGGNG